jgi:hypothetical protein
MALKRSKIAMCSLLLALGSAYACGGDDGNGGGGGSGGDGDGDGDGDGNQEVRIQIVDSVDTQSSQAGIKIRFFNPEDLSFYPGEWVTDSNGYIKAVRPEGSGVFAEGNGLRSDSWNHPPSANHEKNLSRSSSSGSADIVPSLAGYENDPDAAPFAGAVYWLNPQTNEHEPVGCAQIEESEGVKDLRYFTGPLPSSLEARSLEQGTHPGTGGGTAPAAAGKFFIANLAAGKRTITATINGEVIASGTFTISPRSSGSTVNTNPPQKSVVHFGALYVDNTKFTSNPTPADCE